MYITATHKMANKLPQFQQKALCSFHLADNISLTVNPLLGDIEACDLIHGHCKIALSKVHFEDYKANGLII